MRRKRALEEGKGVIVKCLTSQNSLESPENGRIPLYFPQSGDSLNSLESLDDGLF